jgi:micrococcal nuclease
MFIAVACSGSWTVTRVVDGDTIWVRKGLTSEKVRLKGVDAPEIPHPEMGQFNNDPFGHESKQCLIGLLHGRTVRLAFATPAGTPERDKYGRLLAYVYAGDALINAELIRHGCARAFRKFDHPEREKFMALEAEARRKRIGLWARDQ